MEEDLKFLHAIAYLCIRKNLGIKETFHIIDVIQSLLPTRVEYPDLIAIIKTAQDNSRIKVGLFESMYRHIGEE